MTEFEPRSSAIASDRAVNCATLNAKVYIPDFGKKYASTSFESSCLKQKPRNKNEHVNYPLL